jgi:hypothetical protein
MAAAQIRGSAAPAKAAARRWLAQPSARILRFAPLAPSTVLASLRRGAFGGLAAGAAYKVSFFCFHFISCLAYLDLNFRNVHGSVLAG